jgi:hypothetical protein
MPTSRWAVARGGGGDGDEGNVDGGRGMCSKDLARLQLF